METKIDETLLNLVELASGHKVWLKKRITWDDQKRINAPLYAGTKIKIDPLTNQPETIEADADVYEKQQEMEIMVLLNRIEGKDGQSIQPSKQLLGTLDTDDYELLLSEAKKIYIDIKKKSKMTPESAEKL